MFLVKNYLALFLTRTLAPTVGSGKTRSQLHQISIRNATTKNRNESRKKAEEDLRLLREETLKEREILRKETEDTHHRLEEALRHQEQLKKLNENMQ